MCFFRKKKVFVGHSERRFVRAEVADNYAARMRFTLECRKMAHKLIRKSRRGYITIDDIHRYCPRPEWAKPTIYCDVFNGRLSEFIALPGLVKSMRRNGKVMRWTDHETYNKRLKRYYEKKD
jgi:hypothetical protein